MCVVFVQVLLEMWIQGSLNVDYVAIVIQEEAKKKKYLLYYLLTVFF